ncbi:response regulator [Paenibacillus sp. GD4]|uniref:response regulator transcription factor n=1 Tax=Paenibacillus sp. GD4 TaxID=3068890 RepID=UPI0027966D83|nr:helix-turn-helix domain-containing protein [Paenibacillus sp. GD4]MDQ1914129.1 response regulator [Paenibacillus sp. GD4]
MNLIIVDDEPLAIRSVMNAIDWSKLGIEHVYDANSVKQAKDRFAEHRIGIMLCDIEMPKESGLELLAWVREHHPSTVSLFLTCHADFRYAKEAIRLGSLDYLLKPTPPDELEAAIRKAIEQWKAEHELKRLSESWVKHHPLFIEWFWMDIISRTISSSPEAVRTAALERNIRLPADLAVMPVRIQVRRWHKELTPRDEKLMEYALFNAFQEISVDIGEMHGIIAPERHCLVAMLAHITVDKVRMKRTLQMYIENCRKFFYCDLSLYVGEPTTVHELPEAHSRLEMLMRNNVASENQVLFLDEKPQVDGGTVPWPDMKLWLIMLQEGSKDRLLKELNQFLKQLQTVPGLKELTLHQFYQDFIQIVYALLAEKGIQAHSLFQDHVSVELSNRSADSVMQLREWAIHLVDKALGYAEEIEKAESVVGKVKAYIVKQLHEDINRETIASSFFLHPDYLNRIFKKETGQSMTEFLLNERMRAAEEMLTKTDMPVTKIALNVGYANTSHFAKSFKKQYGNNPNEYRQLKR